MFIALILKHTNGLKKECNLLLAYQYIVFICSIFVHYYSFKKGFWLVFLIISWNKSYKLEYDLYILSKLWQSHKMWIIIGLLFVHQLLNLAFILVREHHIFKFAIHVLIIKFLRILILLLLRRFRLSLSLRLILIGILDYIKILD